MALPTSFRKTSCAFLFLLLPVDGNFNLFVSKPEVGLVIGSRSAALLSSAACEAPALLLLLEVPP